MAPPKRRSSSSSSELDYEPDEDSVYSSVFSQSPQEAIVEDPVEENNAGSNLMLGEEFQEEQEKASGEAESLPKENKKYDFSGIPKRVVLNEKLLPSYETDQHSEDSGNHSLTPSSDEREPTQKQSNAKFDFSKIPNRTVFNDHFMTSLPFFKTCGNLLHYNYCPDASCRKEHNWPSSTFVYTRLIALEPAETLLQLLKFVCAHREGFLRFFKVFCNVVGERKMTDDLLWMARFCERPSFRVDYYSYVFEGLVKAGLSKVEAAEEMLSIVKLTSELAVDTVVEIIMRTDDGIIHFVDILSRLIDLPGYALKKNAVARMYRISNREADPKWYAFVNKLTGKIILQPLASKRLPMPTGQCGSHKPSASHKGPTFRPQPYPQMKPNWKGYRTQSKL